MGDQFTRREVNRALLASALAIADDIPILRGTVPAVLFDFAIAGGSFHGLETAKADLTVGQGLSLVAEPDNPHDPQAVAVHLLRGPRLGYIPRIANQPIARMLRDAVRIEATVVAWLNIRRTADIPAGLVFTGFSLGDPQVRLVLM